MAMPDFSLKDRVAIITGGRRGVGKAIALCFAGAGADVVVCDRVIDDGEMEKAAEEIRALGRKSLALKVDITVKSDVDAMVDRVVKDFGTVDILVNSAAANIAVPLLDLREDGLDRIINTNLKGYFLCCQAVGKVMVEKEKGVVINMSSTAALKGGANMSVYSATKAGVKMLTQSLALEWAPYNIRVNAIGPSMVKTKFSEPLWRDLEVLKQIEADIPLYHRLAEPEEIVGAALFLASDAASYITGQTIYIDAGTSA
jgi:NAD(P)-dependent dehydrogenase (short-subunit alcohol dehydrogenase family)